MILTYGIESDRGAVIQVVAAEAKRNYRVGVSNSGCDVMRPVTRHASSLKYKIIARDKKDQPLAPRSPITYRLFSS